MFEGEKAEYVRRRKDKQMREGSVDKGMVFVTGVEERSAIDHAEVSDVISSHGA